MKRYGLAFCLSIAILALTACTTAVSTGASAAYDHYSIHQSMEDRSITHTANNRIYDTVKIKGRSNVAIATYDGEVVLAGHVPTKENVHQVALAVAKVGGVKKVYNFLQVGKPEDLHGQLRDSWISTKINTQYLTDGQVDPSAIKVLTQGGVVFLMGAVTPQMAAEAAKDARTTKGVHEVVKIFQYMHFTPTPVDKKPVAHQKKKKHSK